MSRLIRRAATAVLLGTAAIVPMAAPALAGEGQAYPLPGFPSSHASCVGVGLDFGAHYGVDGSSFPEVTHGEIGPALSGHARDDGPGAVGAFNSALAQNHGDIGSCLP
jgi:hypothetical protein